MSEIFDSIRDFTTLSCAIRMFLAVFCGALIGLEREFRRRPAGFRTHILICLGACLTTLTSQFLALYLHMSTDIGRLGAQVVSGVGFIGAGTIIVTRRHGVKGLTTAAGLWVAAIIGAVTGAGFFEGAIAGTFFLLLAEIVFSKFEFFILAQRREIVLYIEYTRPRAMNTILEIMGNRQLKIANLEITRGAGTTEKHCAVLRLRPSARYDLEHLLTALRAVEDVCAVEQL